MEDEMVSPGDARQVAKRKSAAQKSDTRNGKKNRDKEERALKNRIDQAEFS